MISLQPVNRRDYILFEGEIKEVLNRVGSNKIVTTRGHRYQEFTRGVIDITLILDYLSEDDYENLKLYYLNPLVFDIENTDNGKIYRKYLIDVDSLNLTKERDYENDTFYYKGNLQMVKV